MTSSHKIAGTESTETQTRTNSKAMG